MTSSHLYRLKFSSAQFPRPNHVLCAKPCQELKVKSRVRPSLVLPRGPERQACKSTPNVWFGSHTTERALHRGDCGVKVPR